MPARCGVKRATTGARHAAGSGGQDADGGADLQVRPQRAGLKAGSSITDFCNAPLEVVQQAPWEEYDPHLSSQPRARRDGRRVAGASRRADRAPGRAPVADRGEAAVMYP